MADQDKSLKFSVKTDDKGLKATAASLKDLKKGSEDLNKSLGILNKGFGEMGKSLKDISKNFSSFKKDLMEFSKDAGKQSKELEKYVTTLKNLNAALNSNRRGGRPSTSGVTGMAGIAAQGGSGFGGGASPSSPLYVHIVGSNFAAGGGTGGAVGGGATQLIPAPGGGYTVVPPGGQPPGGGGGQGQQPNNQGMMQTGRFLQQFGALLGQAAERAQGMKTENMQNMATVMATRGDMFKRAIGGDLSDVLAFQVANQKGTSFKEQQGRGLLHTGNFANFLGAAGQGGATGNAGMAALGAAKGAFGAGANEVMQRPQADEAKVTQESVELVKRMQPILFASFQTLMANSGAMLGANRRLGNQSMRAAGLGIGAGMQPQEAWQFFAGGANAFGQNAMMGKAPGEMTIPGKKGSSPFGLIEPTTGEIRPFGGTSDKTVKTPGEEGLGQRTLRLQRKGFDANSMLDMMGSMQSMMGGDLKERGGTAEKILTDAISAGTIKGLTDIQTLEALARAISDASTGRGGIGSGTGVLANILTAGMTPGQESPTEIRQRAQGLGALSTGAENDPWLMAQSMAGAREVLGDEAPLNAQAILGHASMTDLLKPNAAMEAYGITPTQGVDEFRKRMTSIAATVGGGDPTIGDELQRYGGDAMSLFKAHKGDKTFFNRFAAGAQSRLESFKNIDLTSVSQALQGLGETSDQDFQTGAFRNKIGGLRDVGGSALGAEQAKATATMEAFSKAFTPENAKLFGDVFHSTGGFVEKLANLPSGKIEDSVKIIDALDKFIIEVNKVDLSRLKKNTVEIQKIGK